MAPAFPHGWASVSNGVLWELGIRRMVYGRILDVRVATRQPASVLIHVEVSPLFPRSQAFCRDFTSRLRPELKGATSHTYGDFYLRFPRWWGASVDFSPWMGICVEFQLFESQDAPKSIWGSTQC